MKNEYIIVSKTAIQKRIEELEYKLSNEKESEEPLQYLLGEFQGKINSLKQLLSQSTPLIPEIEKAINSGIRSFESNAYEMPELIEEIQEDYISNLKLNI